MNLLPLREEARQHNQLSAVISKQLSQVRKKGLVRGLNAEDLPMWKSSRVSKAQLGNAVREMMTEFLDFEPRSMPFPDEEEALTSSIINWVDEELLREQLADSLPVSNLMMWLRGNYQHLTDAELLRLYHELVRDPQWQSTLGGILSTTALNTIVVTYHPHKITMLIGSTNTKDVDNANEQNRFKIEPVEESQLVDAMNILIQQAEQTESGQSFELFDQGSILDDAELDRAKSLLIEEGNARHGLRVADLFRLEFVVAKQGQQQESFEDIDSAASNGTVLMAKLVTGLAMLHLMQDKRHQMKAVCYLDEALALDTKNQANLIEIADQFGFALIFASPAPLTTARYCVPIHQANGKNHISKNSWQIFEPIESKELSQPQVDPSV